MALGAGSGRVRPLFGGGIHSIEAGRAGLKLGLEVKFFMLLGRNWPRKGPEDAEQEGMVEGTKSRQRKDRQV